MNFILAIVIFVIIGFYKEYLSEEPKVGKVMKIVRPEAGLKEKDTIQAIDGEKVENMDRNVERLYVKTLIKKLTLQIKRDNEQFTCESNINA